MINIDNYSLEFYQKKCLRLEMDLLSIEQELVRARSKQGIDYQILYETLKEEIQEERKLRVVLANQESLKIQQLLSDNDKKWMSLQDQLKAHQRAQVEELRGQAARLYQVISELQAKNGKLQNQIDNSDCQVLRIKIEGLKKQNERLRTDNCQMHYRCDQKITKVKEQCESEIEKARVLEEQKVILRIQELETKVKVLSETINQQAVKIDPEREKMISQLQKQKLDLRNQQSNQIEAINRLMTKKLEGMKNVQKDYERSEKLSLQNLKQAHSKIRQLEDTIFVKQREQEMQMLRLKQEMSEIRQKEVNDLKEQLNKIQKEFEEQRIQTKRVIENFEEDNIRIKGLWQEDKKKFIEDKKVLKQKIEDLRERMKAMSDENKVGQTEKLLKSLKNIQAGEDHFNNYENAITFLDRQVKKATIKIQEKDRQLSHMVKEMHELQKETSAEIEYVKEKSRYEIKKLNDTILALEEDVNRLYEELRNREKFIQKKEKELGEERQNLQAEVLSLKKIIEQMERDYHRLTDHKKNLEDSFREERENVITAKVDVNQQRKNKWIEMERQRNEMEIVYREREFQMKNNFEIATQNFRKEKQKMVEENQQLRAELKILSHKLEEVVPQSANKQNKIAEYHKKLATLDVEIALTQNLFNVLSSATARESHHKRTELDEVSERNSDRYNSEQSRNSLNDYEMFSPDLKRMQNSNTIDKFAFGSFNPQQFK